MAIYVLRYYRVVNQPVASVMNAVQIQVFNFLYGSMAESLTKLENHRTDVAYQDSLIAKLFLFQVCWVT